MGNETPFQWREYVPIFFLKKNLRKQFHKYFLTVIYDVMVIV